MVFHERHYSRGVGPRALAQRPADCFPDEEVVMARLQEAVAIEPVGVRRLLEAQLMEDCGARNPEVWAPDPFVDNRCRARTAPDNVAHGVRRQSVDGVPPGCGWGAMG